MVVPLPRKEFFARRVSLPVDRVFSQELICLTEKVLPFLVVGMNGAGYCFCSPCDRVLGVGGGQEDCVRSVVRQKGVFCTGAHFFGLGWVREALRALRYGGRPITVRSGQLGAPLSPLGGAVCDGTMFQ